MKQGKFQRECWVWFKAMLFVAPALIFYVIFITMPIVNTIEISFYKWDGASPVMEFVGLGNYREVLTDPIFFKALSHNIYWILFTIFVPVLLGLILAVMLQQRFVKFRLLFRVTYYIPAVVSLVVVGIVWRWIYNPFFGILNKALTTIGLSTLTADWLGNENLALTALLVAGSWTYYGFCMVIFLAALSGIDECYREVALIEGANPVQMFFYVTLPLVRNTVTLLVLNSLIGSFKVFDIIYVMTRGGPFRSTEVIGSYMFSTAFNMSQVGKGACIAVILALIIAICSSVYLYLSEKGDVNQ